MNIKSPEFTKMAFELQSGQLTKNEASERYGIPKGTLAVYLSRAGIKLGRQGLAGTAAARKAAAEADPDKVAAEEAAIARVMAGETTAYSEAKADPRLVAGTISMKVRKLRIDQGAVVEKAAGRNGRPRTAQQALDALRTAREALKLAQEQVEQAEKDLDILLLKSK